MLIVIGLMVVKWIGGDAAPASVAEEVVEAQIDTAAETENEETTTTFEQLETRIDQGATALGVKIVPHEVLEDSRCPANANCIQAGTVRVRATLESGLGSTEQVFTLGTPITTEAEVVTLVEVLPQAQPDLTIAPSDYMFIFEVARR